MKTVKIGNRYIGKAESCFIIAEAGLNHNGDVELAKELIEKAAEVGADAIKFQSYHAENFISKDSEYYQLFKKLELSEEEFKELYKFAKQKGMIFLSTPLDLEYANVLSEIGVPAFKIASGDLTFMPLLKKVAETGKPVILSTGMANISEIYEAVSILRTNSCEDIILLHCISSYPTPFDEVNLRAITTLKNVFNLPVGYSDHTLGSIIPIVAVALGAKVIEKHFTLDKNMGGPDHKLSADPEEFKYMIKEIRIVERALGDGIKRPMECEESVRLHGRRCIVAKRFIGKGEMITESDITYKRPAIGIKPKFKDIILNRRIKKDKNEEDAIMWSDLLED
ncbi:N-acetylneuraminate synthase family protein [Methanothermococcus sp. SCGC AD-155-K20]|nr:N-acetylneuraminate synthase family protein [Methanothermococcus sp. SCGC AD-155-K20]